MKVAPPMLHSDILDVYLDLEFAAHNTGRSNLRLDHCTVKCCALTSSSTPSVHGDGEDVLREILSVQVCMHEVLYIYIYIYIN